ncbi:TonB family protein [Pedobacter africanus]|uniref:TonB family C-terminal domain-containing protein n=1 Tax=Pedobacter africanus TaxID=151894 RepID=A0A1W2BHR2_9SPHI|nr:TonB family protein [Pedobacter africanus]SMC72212.1 TonB family C-terminal domain-containing protein [Pedobacter africanus]
MSTAHYILQVNIYLIVFYGFYKLLLDKETYFTLNRIYLVSAGLLSLAIPFLRFEWFSKQPVAEPVYVGVAQVNTFMTQVIVEPAATDHFSPGNVIVFIYVLGVLIFAGKLIWQLSSVSMLLKQGGPGSAFSFFNRKKVDANLPQVQTINRHEEVHMRQLHSLDVIFFELLSLFTWFNPVIYAYKRAVKNIHEYLADEAAAEFQGDKKEYALLLLSNAFGVSSSTLTNSFFNKSLIKKRIFMLHKQRSKRTVFLKYGLFLPLFAITLLLSSATIRDNQKIQDIADEIPLNNPVEVVKEVVNEAIIPQVSKITVPDIKSRQSRVLKTGLPTESGDMTYKNDASWDAFYRYLKMTTRYPAEAHKNNIQGNTIIRFKIKDGAIEDLGIAKKLGGGCDAEVMRVVLAFPGFESIKNGSYAIRFIFYLSDGVGTTEKLGPASVKGYTSLNDIFITGYKGPQVVGNNGSYDASKIYDFVSIETQPTFPGGMTNFYKYLKGEIKYPEEAKKNKIQGKVFLSFIVETDGELTGIRVERKLGSGTDEEAVRVIKASPRWVPGTQGGKAVRVKYNIPISFSLGEANTPPTQLKTGSLQLRRPGNGISFRDEKGNLISLSGTGSANPLYVVDGTPVSGNYMSSMVPDNIESVTILKDAAASALYGAKAANGVILITTKTGKPVNLKEVVVTGSEKE